MDVNPLLASLPAVLALLLKGGIFLYARHSGVRTPQTRLYLYFLFALSIQNLAEISYFYGLGDERGAEFPGTVFYAAGILALALFLHLALALARDDYREGRGRTLLALVYLAAGALELLLLFSPWLVAGFERVGWSVARVPGPLYAAFEAYAAGTLLAAIGLLLYGARRQPTPQKRMRNAYVLLGVIPMVAIVLAVLTLLHLGEKWINTSVILPAAMGVFLVITAYATHQHRLFDIQFYIPWSRERQRKTAFYRRLHAMVAEVADLGSVNELLNRLADTLRCPVALLSGERLALAQTAGARTMVQIPRPLLARIDRIAVANEIEATQPEIYRAMKHHAVAAVVPFYPHSHKARGWLLLGDAFGEQVHSSNDFKRVEELFERMGERFLDRMLAMRARLNEATRQIETLETHRHETVRRLATLEEENRALATRCGRLMKEQAADSLSAAATTAENFGPTLTLLGHDRALHQLLRGHFRQLTHYVGPASGGFRRQPLPDVLICRLEADAPRVQENLLELLMRRDARPACLLYGPGAREFLGRYGKVLRGSLTEILADHAPGEMLVRRVQALAHLRRGVQALPDAEEPLIGQNPAFVETLNQAGRLAGLDEPVVIRSTDTGQALALAAHLHVRGGAQGKLVTLEARALERPTGADRDDHALAHAVAEARGGTLVLAGTERLAQAGFRTLAGALPADLDARLILVGEAPAAEIENLTGRQMLLLELPGLAQRADDIPALVHYFTLQFNLQAGTQLYLSQSQVDGLLAAAVPKTVAALRHAVFDLLRARPADSGALAPEDGHDLAAADKTLDQCVAEFEARIIAQTLKRCDGNKSRAARLLGLRPNTLHYKLERYGLSDVKKR